MSDIVAPVSKSSNVHTTFHRQGGILLPHLSQTILVIKYVSRYLRDLFFHCLEKAESLLGLGVSPPGFLIC